MPLRDVFLTADPEDADSYDERIIKDHLPHECPIELVKGEKRLSRFVRLTQYYLWYREHLSDFRSRWCLEKSITSLLEEEEEDQNIERKHLWENFAGPYDDRFDREGVELWEAITDDIERLACRYEQWELRSETEEDD